jgi:hypothetical protein
MAAGDKAYRRALQEIRRVKESGKERLDLSGKAFHALSRIPPEIAELSSLATLILDESAVADLSPVQNLNSLSILSLEKANTLNLSPLASLTELRVLWLGNTQVEDLSPLANLTKLQILSLRMCPNIADLSPLAALLSLHSLWLSASAVTDLTPLASLSALTALSLPWTDVSDLAPLAGLVHLESLDVTGTRVYDLRPIRGLTALAQGKKSESRRRDGLYFSETPATTSDSELARLASIPDYETRTSETLAYLNTLPPWPQPYTPKARPDGQPPRPIGRTDPPLTLEALIEAQDLAGWRFSPTDGALALYIRDLPLDQRQEQLARLSAERCAKLLSSLGPRTNSGGLRQDVWDEAGQFAGLLSDGSRSLSDRSLDLWGSLIAIGDLLEANERGRRDGRDRLDLLPEEARAALSTFLGMASNLVRSFPEARALDDEHGGFAGRGAGRQLVTDILQDAVRSAIVSQDSANLIGKVAAVSAGEGKQADKASTVSVKGLRNLIVVTTLIGSAVGTTIGGLSNGVLEDIGGDVSDHFGLGEKAVDFLDGAGDKLEELLDALPPDEAANLRARLQDYQAGRNRKP